ncbi:unnamed protein product, partial [marine sediment metagenome]
MDISALNYKSRNYAVVARQAAGISEKTYYNWLVKGKRGEEPFLQFLQLTRQAEAEVSFYSWLKRGIVGEEP